MPKGPGKQRRKGVGRELQREGRGQWGQGDKQKGHQEKEELTEKCQTQENERGKSALETVDQPADPGCCDDRP